MKKPITNYGLLLAEIAYYEGIGNDFQVEKLSSQLDKARKKDKELADQQEQLRLRTEGVAKDGDN
jgi:hypothetical protein